MKNAKSNEPVRRPPRGERASYRLAEFIRTLSGGSREIRIQISADS